jgi:hypothetical protein
MAPQGPRGARRATVARELLARTHSAGTHRSRVPRCGAGPPVWTGPPAPASRSPRAHRSCSLHGHAGGEQGSHRVGAAASPPPAAHSPNWSSLCTSSCQARPAPLACAAPAAGGPTRAHSPACLLQSALSASLRQRRGGQRQVMASSVWRLRQASTGSGGVSSIPPQQR